MRQNHQTRTRRCISLRLYAAPSPTFAFVHLFALNSPNSRFSQRDMDSLQNRKICAVALIIIIGFIFAEAFHHLAAYYYKLPYPYGTFLFLPTDRFMDFFNIHSGYFCHLVFFRFPFYLLPKIPAFILFNGLFLIFWGLTLKKYLFVAGNIRSIFPTLLIGFFTYPFLMCMDRGNFEAYVFILLALFLFFLIEKKKYVLSPVFLGAAIAMKIDGPLLTEEAAA